MDYRHHATDVIAGALLGSWVAVLTYHLCKFSQILYSSEKANHDFLSHSQITLLSSHQTVTSLSLLESLPRTPQSLQVTITRLPSKLDHQEEDSRSTINIRTEINQMTLVLDLKVGME